MKKILKNISILVLLLTILSCSKEKKQEKLIGSWDRAVLTAAEANIQEVWSFADNGAVSITVYYGGSFTSVSGTYSIEKKFPSKFFIRIYNLGVENYYDGLYQILKHNQKYLTIVRVENANGSKEGAYLYQEFVKRSE